MGVAEVPEWKQQALGKAPTFGIRDNRSIKDQRESLPIFKLREQLVQAVMDNQVGAGVMGGGWVGAGWCWLVRKGRSVGALLLVQLAQLAPGKSQPGVAMCVCVSLSRRCPL